MIPIPVFLVIVHKNNIYIYIIKMEEEYKWGLFFLGLIAFVLGIYYIMDNQVAIGSVLLICVIVPALWILIDYLTVRNIMNKHRLASSDSSILSDSSL